MKSVHPVSAVDVFCCAAHQVVIMGDGQATQNDFIVKPNVRKVRVNEAHSSAFLYLLCVASPGNTSEFAC
jgi:hypothetical protein